MKKIIILILVLMFSMYMDVNAKENDTSFVSRTFSDVFAIQEYKSGGKRMYKAQQYYMSKNSNTEIGYCIELGAKLGTTVYSSTSDYNMVGLSENQASYIKLLVYYGYQYSDHYDYKYYLATQELIWEYLTGDEIYWVSAEDYNASRINVDNMKQDILNLVNSHTIKPKFENVNINYKESVELIDSNNVLNDYEVTSIKNGSYKINGNKITITSTNFSNVEISFAKKIIKSEDEVFLYSDVSQNILIPGLVDNSSITYNFENLGVRLKVNKKDYGTKENIINSNVSFKLYDVSNDKYIEEDNRDEFDTNSGGIAVLPYIKNGNYKLEEVDNGISDYLYNDDILDININANNIVYDEEYGYVYNVDFYNYKPIGNIEINKKGEEFVIDNNNYHYGENNLQGVSFDIITKDDIIYNDREFKSDDVIATITTNSEGIANIGNLPLGKYIIKEINTDNRYMLDENIYEVDLKYIDAYTSVINMSLEIKNFLKKGKLEINKIDSKSGSPLDGVGFVIYDDNNNKIYEGKTNKEGKIILDDLVYGNYYVKEFFPLKGYIFNDSIVEFKLDDDNKYKYLEISNDRIKPPKTFNKYIDNYLIILIIIVSFCINRIKIML